MDTRKIKSRLNRVVGLVSLLIGAKSIVDGLHAMQHEPTTMPKAASSGEKPEDNKTPERKIQDGLLCSGFGIFVSLSAGYKGKEKAEREAVKKSWKKMLLILTEEIRPILHFHVDEVAYKFFIVSSCC